MKTRMIPSILLALAVVFVSTTAQTVSAARPHPEQILEGALSGAVERALYYEMRGLQANSSKNWDNKIRAWRGKMKTERYKIYGPRNPFTGKRTWTWGYRPARVYENLNHGVWTRSWVRIENARDEFDVKFRNFRKTPGKPEIQFQIYARALFRGQVEARHYNHGAQLWRVTANGRARAHIYLNMRVYLYNNATRIGWRVEGADIKYSDAVLDRVGHVRGYAARVIGDTFTGAVKQWFPQKERDAIAKAKQAVHRSINGSLPIRNQLASLIRMFR